MGKLFQRTCRSAGYARERMKLLLLSDHMECSPQMMKMLKRDLIHTVGKYVPVNEDAVTIRISRAPYTLTASIPVKSERK